MRKVLLLVAALSAAVFSGCSSILVRPAADNVKTLAIVSVYMNDEFYNTKSPRAQEGENSFMHAVGGLVKKTKVGETLLRDREEREKQQIVTYALKVYAEQLRGVNGWQLLPVEHVIASRNYQKIMSPNHKSALANTLVSFLQEGEKSKWVTPNGMHYIPAASVARSGTHYYGGDARDPTENGRKALAVLCKELKVDAVALIELDMGYRFGKVAKVTIMGTTRAKPSISSALVIVTKDGDVAVNTGAIVRGQGERYEGDDAGMVKDDRLFLKQKDNKIVEVFNQAIEKSASGIRKKLEKAYAKGK